VLPLDPERSHESGGADILRLLDEFDRWSPPFFPLTAFGGEVPGVVGSPGIVNSLLAREGDGGSSRMNSGRVSIASGSFTCGERRTAS
jgi:hypothetical protein